MSAEDATKVLNELYQAYEKALSERKPYAIFKTRVALQDFQRAVENKLTLVSLDTLHQFSELIPIPDALEHLAIARITALREHDYETAASLFHQYREKLALLLEQHGYPANNHYFSKNGKIYFKKW